MQTAVKAILAAPVLVFIVAIICGLYLDKYRDKAKSKPVVEPNDHDENSYV